MHIKDSTVIKILKLINRSVCKRWKDIVDNLLANEDIYARSKWSSICAETISKNTIIELIQQGFINIADQGQIEKLSLVIVN